MNKNQWPISHYSFAIVLIGNMLPLWLIPAAALATDPQDPPFDLSKVLFSGSLSDHAVLQRAPRRSAVFGTAAPGATVTVHATGPAGWSYTSPPAAVASSPDAAVHGTWKVLLPARPAGLGYALAAVCSGCANATAATLADVAFGEVWLCSGQSNMEDPLLTTLGRNDSYAAAAAGAYDHVRLFQLGWRMDRRAPTWVLPQEPDDGQGYPQQAWALPRGCDDHRPGPGPTCSLQRFSAMCWYFGRALADKMVAAAEAVAEAEGDPAVAPPVPIGLIHASIGGTTIQQWMPPAVAGNGTCTENNCGHCEQLDPRKPTQPGAEPKCTNATQRTVWSCPSGTCSTLWHGMIAPWVNHTIAGALWYQGEQNVANGGGSVAQRSGYACQQANLISSWRAAFSATAGTTDGDFPFGVTSLAGGCSEAFPLWSAYQHFDEAAWQNCTDGAANQRTSPLCIDMKNDWAGGLRAAQTGGYGHLPNAAMPNTFLGQAYDHGEPCNCDRKAQPPHGCWANGRCYGWDQPFSLNRTWNYQNSGIHPRAKETVGRRLARAAFGLMLPTPQPQPTPKLSGCRLERSSGGGGGGGNRLVLLFDRGLLGGEGLSLQPPAPGEIPLELQVGPAVASGPGNTSGWVFAAALQVINDTALAVTLPPGTNAATPTAVRYAWGDYPCCPLRPGQDKSTFFCPPAACPIVSATTKEPAVPFWARIEGGKCACDAPWVCDE